MTESKKFLGLYFLQHCIPPIKYTSLQGVPSGSFLPSCTGAIICHFSVGLGRGEQGGTPCKLFFVGGGAYAEEIFFDSVISITCDFERGPVKNYPVYFPLFYLHKFNLMVIGLLSKSLPSWVELHLCGWKL